MRKLLGASFARGCARIAPKWRACVDARMRIGSTGEGRCPRLATRRLGCSRWDWRRERTVRNRTAEGRPFTGDGSGDFLFPVLREAGFASQAKATRLDDGMKLTDLWISSVVRCAPPGNKPTPEEQRNCTSWLDQEMNLLKNLRVVVCLGRIAFDGLLAHESRLGKLPAKAGFVFAHGAEYTLPSGLIAIASYHPSLQNTNTGKLTREMFLSIFMRARKLAER